MNLKFQVVCMDIKGYILTHEDFRWDELPKMLEYIEKHTTGISNKVIITRWNSMTGERE